MVSCDSSVIRLTDHLIQTHIYFNVLPFFQFVFTLGKKPSTVPRDEGPLPRGACGGSLCLFVFSYVPSRTAICLPTTLARVDELLLPSHQQYLQMCGEQQRPVRPT